MQKPPMRPSQVIMRLADRLSASISSGLLLEATGYATLSLVGAALVIAPVALMIRYGVGYLRAAPNTGT